MKFLTVLALMFPAISMAAPSTEEAQALMIQGLLLLHADLDQLIVAVIIMFVSLCLILGIIVGQQR